MRRFRSNEGDFTGVEAIFFDAAGTLIRPAEPIGVTYAAVLGRHGFGVDAAAASAAFAATWHERPGPWGDSRESRPDGDPARVEREWWRRTVAEVVRRMTGRDPTGEPAFVDAFDELFTWFGRGAAWRLFPDVRRALHGISSGRRRLFVLSNFDARLRNVLRDLDVAECFEAMILSGEVGAAKPDPRIFAFAARTAGMSPHRCLHVGDEFETDAIGALHAGFRAWLVRRPTHDLAALQDALALHQGPPREGDEGEGSARTDRTSPRA